MKSEELYRALKAIARYNRDHGRLPTHRELGAVLGMPAPPAYYRFSLLRDAGEIVCKGNLTQRTCTLTGVWR